MPTPTAADLAARLDRLPSSRHVWNLVILISLGACFEFYDLFLTAYVVPGMAKHGLFTPASLGIFGILAPLKVAGPGTFVFAWIGAGVRDVLAAGNTPDLALIVSPPILGPMVALGLLALLPVAWRKWKRRDG